MYATAAARLVLVTVTFCCQAPQDSEGSRGSQAPQGPQGPQGPKAAATASLRTVARGAQSNLDDARMVTIRSAADWAKLWRSHAPDTDPPGVDFSREMVVGVFLGSRPTAGFQVEIVGTRDERDALVVQYRVTTPAREAVTAAVLTMPYHLVAVPTRAGEVKFEKQP